MGLWTARWGAWCTAPQPAGLFVATAIEPTEIAPEAIPAPDEPAPNEIDEPHTRGAPAPAPPDEVDVPLFGKLRVSDLGLPTFTFLLGLVDGFNPCAMWVLLFLLSVLVNLKDRRKIAAIAGTFVVISGLAYFAFMAAWLNVFMLLGFTRPAQVGLGIVATIIGAANVKDFFAFGWGLSFSIPESAKPGIYTRVRQIVSARYLTAAIAGAVILAVLVNTIELLCTAGLPALYTQILAYQDFPSWKNYAYLALYNVAYMLDDSIMLTVAVVTLSHRKLQEREGRWLKLISGLVILGLGFLLLFKPDWLA
jgi:cytochrome c biogenesis protein CcdA